MRPGEGMFEYYEGSELVVAAEPLENYTFFEWTGDVPEKYEDEKEIQVVMDRNKSLTAHFEEEDHEPKEIQDWEDLHEVREDLEGDYVLMNDLDEDTDYYDEYASEEANEGKGWQPIGDDDNRFTGTFDGNEYEIKGLYVNRTDENYVGLFGATYDAEIANVGLADAKISGRSEVGGLMGKNGQGTVLSSYATGDVSGDWDVGGIIGYNYGTVKNSYASGDVTGGGNGVGGLMGNNAGGTVENSYATGDVSGGTGVGGLMAYNYGTVSNSYATGTVSGDWDVGGLVGVLLGRIYYSYAVGPVEGEVGVGGLVGYRKGDIQEACFWDIETTGQNESAGWGATGLTTEEMQDITNFKDADWNITSVDHEESDPEHIWNIGDNETYPFLSWEATEEFNLTVNIEGEGTVEVDGEEIEDGETLVYENSTKVDLKAIAEKGWVFDEWTGDYQGDEAEIILEMDQDKEITAHFEDVRKRIYDWEDLHEGREDLTGDYVLMNDLNEDTDYYDEYASEEANEGKGWELIGDNDDRFTGTFDGDGYEIRDLYIDRIETNNVGLFGATNDAEIANVGVVDVKVSGESEVGGLVGVNREGTLENSYATGNVSGQGWYIGGLVGVNSGTVNNSHATGNVVGDWGAVGGLVGENDWGGGKVENSYATSDVNGEGSQVGGLVGANRGEINNSYATGEVSGYGKVGGLVGYLLGGIYNSYAAGPVEGKGTEGGLVGGRKGGIQEASFWDIEATGQNESAGGTGLTTEEMQNITNFKDAGWNITSVEHEETDPEHIWNIVDNETYPFLSWEDLYGPEEFNLTINVEGEGTVEVDGEEVVDGETLVYENGTEVDLRAAADEGWIFNGWTGAHTGSEKEITITMDENKEITAVFEETVQYDLTVNIDGEGSTVPAEGTHTYEEGEVVTVEAAPDEGWDFVGWTGDYDGTDPTINLTMDANKSITAVFEEVVKTYELTIAVEGEGTTDPDPGEHIYENGTAVTVEAVPSEGWEFGEWTGAVSGTDPTMNVTMDANKRITAVFEEVVEYDLTINIEGEGTVDVDPDQDEYENGTEVTLTAYPDNNWRFDEWTGDYEGEEDSEVITITMDEDKEITAHFEELLEDYELTINIEGEGDVVVEPDQKEYEEGTEVTLTADPDKGYAFKEWTGDHEGMDEQITITMNDDMHITAVFEEESEYYELEVNIEGEGDVEVEPEQDEYETGTEVTLTAVPAEDWKFVEWSGDETSTEVDITVIMDEDKNITAHFEKLAPAEFELSNLTVEPEEPEVGDEIKISVDVINVGELEGEYTVQFYINGDVIGNNTVTIEAGETEMVSTIYEIEEDGEYHIEAEDVGITFTVEEEEEVTTDSWLVVALILSIIALLVFVWKGMRERRFQNEDKSDLDKLFLDKKRKKSTQEEEK